jgi:uncharacterized protein YraI
MAVERIENMESNDDEAVAMTATAAQVTYPIAPGYAVNVRSGPGTSYRIVRVLPEGSRVSISCQRPGDSVSGPYGTTSIWDNIANGEYISDAYVKTGSDGYVAPRCA